MMCAVLTETGILSEQHTREGSKGAINSLLLTLDIVRVLSFMAAELHVLCLVIVMIQS